VRPIEHFIVAFLPAFAYVVVRDQGLPSRALSFVVFVGSQFPDIVDKPLAHVLVIIPSGRVFMHSLPFAIPISAIVLAYGWWTDRPRVAGGFVFAYLLHLFGDNRRVLLEGSIPPDLLWPFVAPKPRPVVPYWAGVNGINLYLWTVFSVVVLSVTVVVVGRDVAIQIRDRG
jgi:membrane-bound metal-dependent hydrolase YbcI (DUF457 family)